MLDLVLLRHGQSTWNADNLFTGWVDVDLTPAGEAEARSGGELLEAEEGLDLRMLHTSVLTRAIRTAEIALAAAGRSWLPVRRDWRLNERHYGDLQGKNKAQIKQEFGEAQLKLWRRSYDTSPPPLGADNPYDVAGDPRYRDLDPGDVPRSECLADVVCDAPNVGTRRAMQANGRFRAFERQNLECVYLHLHWRQVNGLAATRHFIGLLTANLFGGDRRRNLPEFSAKAVQHRFEDAPF